MNAIGVPKRGRLKEERQKPKLLKFGSVSIPYLDYRRGKHHYFCLFYYSNGKRVRETRSTLAKLKARGEEIAIRITNGQTAMLSLREADKGCYLRSLEILQPTGKPLELATAEFAELEKMRPKGVTNQQLVEFWNDNHRAGFIPCATPALIKDFLIDQQGQIGARWYRSLKQQLEVFAGFYTGPLHQLASADINRWLRGLDVGPRSRHNYRAALDQLIRWAIANGNLPKTWSEMEHVPDPGAKFEGEVKIFTPEQLTKLLHARSASESEHGRATETFIPFLVLQAFAGLRHEEMNGEKALLDWRDIDLERGHIYVPKDVAKTGNDRIVPISDNLAAWLAPHVRRNGRVCELDNTSSALNRAKKKAGLPAGRNETRNALRKSFISYRLAVVKNIAQVAEEAGNSPQKIKSNYKRSIPESEGKRWFEIYPTDAEVLQLSFF